MSAAFEMPLSSLQLEENAELLASALRVAGAASWAWDVATGEVLWSRSWHEIAGTDPSTFVPSFGAWQRLIHPDDVRRVTAALEEALARRDGPRELSIDYRVTRADGQVRWLTVRSQISCDERGVPARVVGVAFDVTERKNAEEALRASEEQARARAEELRVLMESTPAIIWIARDAECRSIMGSRAAHDVLRMPMGANLSKTADGGDVAPHFTVRADGRELSPEELPVQRAARGEEISGFEEEVVFDDGTRLHLYGNAVPLRAPDGASRGAIAAFVDITERKRIELLLAQADRRKDEFLAMLAHEMRNPLAPVRTAVHLMRRLIPADPKLSRACDVIEGQTEHLTRLVDDLLDISRIRQGKLELRSERVELCAILARAVETSRPLLEGRELRLTLSLDGPIELTGDSVRLAQVFQNLLVNAAKFTGRGGNVWLSAERAPGEAQVRVRDDGIGIPPEVLPLVFELFAQAERAPEQASGGLGIGLTLVKQLVELHGGTVEALSEGPGRGAELVVHLPLPGSGEARGGVESPLPDEPVEQARSRRGLRVLVVDDNADAAETLEMLLDLDGHSVRVAKAGERALEIAATFRPEVALLDIGLPDIDGYEVASRLRARPETAGALLIALTGYGQSSVAARARAAGFDHHLTKPVSYDVLARLFTAPR